MSEIRWWDVEDVERPTMTHPFSGDPWGPCSGCGHPAYHRIHRDDDVTVRPPSCPSSLQETSGQ